MRILKEKRLKEDFTELNEFDGLDDLLSKCKKEITKMYSTWYSHSKGMDKDDLEDNGYDSLKEMVDDCKEEINSTIKKALFI